MKNKENFFKLIKSKLKSKDEIKILKQQTGSYTTDFRVIVETFNNYFISVFDEKNFNEFDILIDVDPRDKIMLSQTQVKTSIRYLKQI